MMNWISFSMAAVLFAEAINPLNDLGPITQMGVAGIILTIWWIERKERRDRQVDDDKRYAELQAKLLEALKRPIRCPFAKDDGA